MYAELLASNHVRAESTWLHLVATFAMTMTSAKFTNA